MNINHATATIFLVIQNYKEILRHTSPAYYYQKQCDKMNEALECLENALDKLSFYESSDSKKLGGF